jgi:polyhydroxybutyrate depolymerase
MARAPIVACQRLSPKWRPGEVMAVLGQGGWEGACPSIQMASKIKAVVGLSQRNPLFTLKPCKSMPLLEPGKHWRNLRHDGHDRDWLIHLPPSAPAEGAAVVLAFHGSASSAAHLVEFSGLDEVSNEAGFIVVFPQGLGPDRLRRTWNAQGCCGWAYRENIDDVGFTAKILDDLERDFAIDPQRVYATGMSNGGMMAYRLADELSTRFCAIASVAGPAGRPPSVAERPVSVCHFHGTLDGYAPFAGGVGAKSTSKTSFLSAEASVNAWRRRNQCDETFVETTLPTIVNDGTQVTRRQWSNGEANTSVVLYSIDGMGHTWPGRKTRLTHLGPMSGNICASRTMWEFFESSSKARAS